MSKKQKAVEIKKEAKIEEKTETKACVCCECLFRECGSAAKNKNKSGWCGKIDAFVSRKDNRATNCKNFNRK